ncbi:MAG TPA: hypothetical protein VD815_02760 [Candidatus Saccharimonadales bacterium]|nr:hypothetical protein [Candidatus Saccharimonadales bacterium]
MELKANDIRKKYALKPDIRVGNNYYFQWNDSGFGLADSNEINSLTNFIRKLVPMLEQFMKFLQTENVYNAKDPFKDKKHLCIVEKHNKKIFFVMTIDRQGSTLFYREEKCSNDVVVDNGKKMKENGDEVYLLDTDNSSSNNNNHSNNFTDNSNNEVELKWILGELLFDRQKKQEKQ